MKSIDPLYNLDSYTYDLPEDLIAQFPAKKRSASRLMVVDSSKQRLKHLNFTDFPDIIPEGSLLVINNTKVLPVRIRTVRSTGGECEILLLEREKENRWRALTRPARKIHPGDVFNINENLSITILQDRKKGEKLVELNTKGCSLEAILQEVGEVPLPPYIKREEVGKKDRERYQTVYAAKPGSAAAPTAGFHFTPDIFERIYSRGIEVAEITLHIGRDTFQPVRVQDIRDHTMHSEYYSIDKDVAKKMQHHSGPVIAVGTTSLRVLETVARFSSNNKENIKSEDTLKGRTELFIYPGFEFMAVDMLLTNFHLPGSTLLMLVSAFAGRELIIKAYKNAVKNRYRFYSYGDCMLIQ